MSNGPEPGATEHPLHDQYEPEKPIHRAVNISYRALKDRVRTIEHEDYDLWKGKDLETGRESDSWWCSPDEAIDLLAKRVSNELCFLNECMTHLGRDSDRLYCEEHYPDDYIECADSDCDFPTCHTETDYCSYHIWENGRRAEETAEQRGEA